MSIHTNIHNPAGLKLQLGAKFGGHQVTLNICDIGREKPVELLPRFQKDEVVLFLPNSVVLHLLPPPEELALKVNEWLEWEALVLAPALAHVFGRNDKTQKNRLSGALKKLDETIANSAFPVSSKITSAAEVAIFSILYPLYKDPSASNEFLLSNKYQQLINWLKDFENTPEVVQIVQGFANPSAVIAYQALFNGGLYLQQQQNETMASPTAPTVENATDEELKAAETAWSKGKEHIPKLKEQTRIVLPKPNEPNILITSALPYVNNIPHLGNIIGCVLSADVFARFARVVCNYNTLYIGGTDEYGTATETKAVEEGMTCREICDKYYTIHKEIYDWFDISFNYFGRSSCPEQTKIVQDMFHVLNGNGFMFTESVEQLHCERCNRYLADRFVEGGCPHPGCNYPDARGDQCDKCGKLVNAIELINPRCKICGDTPKVKYSNQFFIDLPKLEPLLHCWMKQSSPGWSHIAQTIGRTWLREGLKPRCITRDLKWGVPVPLKDFADKVFYVWFDAVLAYHSITSAYTPEWEQWWRPTVNKDVKVSLYQFMAKDNVPFHSIIFPGMLLGCNNGYTTVSHIMATEYLNYEDGKFSKSRGIGVFGSDARSTGIPSDVWRFYLLYIRPESQDSNFSWADLATKNNSELLNNLGNFINRALVFVKNNYASAVPPVKPLPEDFAFLALCTRELHGYVSALHKAKQRDGIRHILAISRHGNQYLQAKEPWALIKKTEPDKERAATVIGISCNVACLLATLLHPYMPRTSDTLKKQLNIELTPLNPENPEIYRLLPTGHKIGEPVPLFTKLEQARVEELRQKFAGKQSDRLVQENGVEDGKKQEGVLKVDDAKKLEQEIAEQAVVVRKLKESGKNKAEWLPDLNKLLALKDKLKFITPADAGKQKKNK